LAKNEIKDWIKEDQLEEAKIVQKILPILVKTKLKVLDVFTYFGFDAAYFDVNIDLKVSVDDQTVRVHEKWKKLQDQ